MASDLGKFVISPEMPEQARTERMGSIARLLTPVVGVGMADRL
jgi:hypothetical protein